MSPPITARAIGARASAPAPRASASGIMPKIIATVVMMIGRSRIRPACSSASARSFPSPRSWLVKSTSRMPFFVTSPMSMMIPIIVITFMLPPREQQGERDADEAERQREHDRQRLEEGAEERREDQVDEDDGEQERLEHVALGLLEALHVAAEHGVVAGRQAERVDGLLDAVGDVAHGEARAARRRRG